MHNFDLFKALEGAGYTAAGQREIYIPEGASLWEACNFTKPEIPEDWETIFQQRDFSRIPDCSDGLLTLLGDQHLTSEKFLELVQQFSGIVKWRDQ